MADLGTLRPGAANTTGLPSGTPTPSIIGNPGGATALSDDSDSTYDGQNTNTSGGYQYGREVGNTPADFGTMATLFCQLRYGWQSTPSNSNWDDLRARIVRSDGSTILAAADSGGTFKSIATPGTTATPTNSSVVQFDYVDTSAGKTVWDAALIQVHWQRTRTKGGDNLGCRVYEGWITGTYTAAESPSATGALTLPATTVSGTGDQTDSATGALGLAATTVSGTGDQSLDATGAVNLPAVTISGSGTQALDATGAVDLAATVIDGTGLTVVPLTATGALDLAAVTIAGTGDQGHDATGALTLSALTVTGTGAYDTKTATGALTLPSIVIDGTADLSSDATGALSLSAAIIAGSATQTHSATGSLVLAAPTLDGTGVLAISGTGAVTLPATVIDGTGSLVQALTATGALVLGSATISGSGDNGAFQPVIPPAGRRRRQPPEPEPLPPALRARGALVLGGIGVAAEARTQEDIWPFLLSA